MADLSIHYRLTVCKFPSFFRNDKTVRYNRPIISPFKIKAATVALYSAKYKERYTKGIKNA